MSGTIDINKLKAHPKNSHYFTDLEGDKYEEIKRSISENGMRDPVKITTAYTVFSGHQRLRIAKELGLQTIPVEIHDIDEWKAEYLLIAENVERRGQAETDPIKKARIAQFLKEYWGVKNGGDRKSHAHNAQLKTTADIAETIGESSHQTRRILKLNDLIPELQALVSSGKLGTTAAEQIAYLTQGEQLTLLSSKGDLTGTTVQQAKDYREEVSTLREALERAERSEQIAIKRLEEAENKPPEVIEKVIERVVQDERKVNSLEADIQRQQKQLADVLAENELIKKRMRSADIKKEDFRRLENDIQQLNAKRSNLEQDLEDIKEITKYIMKIEEIKAAGMAPVAYSNAIRRQQGSQVLMERLQNAIATVDDWCREMKKHTNRNNVIIDVEVT